jgi:uncharacterized membrane protein YhhN
MAVFWVAKPLPVAALVAAVATLAPPGPLRSGVIVALCLSLVGDILLMLPQRLLALGLGAFLAALVSYVVAFSHGVPWSTPALLLALAPIAPAVGVITRLWPHLGRLRPAVVVYVAALVALAWRMLTRHDAPGVSTLSFAWGLAGGAVFLVADSLLALRRFAGRPIPYPLEIGTYYLAQWCLAAATWS